MIIRKLDGQHDWTFGNGLTDFASNEAAIDENIQTRLLEWVGDCFFALQDGVDWRNRLGVGQQQNLLDELKRVILSSFGVVSVNSVDAVFDPRTRVFNIQYNIDTIFSPSFQGTLNQSIGVV